MKTLKILITLCILLVFSTSYANSQSPIVRDEYNWDVMYGPDILPCLGEVVSGSVTVERFWNLRGYHEKGRGILTGSNGGEYTLDFECNGVVVWNENNLFTFGYTFPIQLKHNGKLVAIIHESYRGVVLIDDWTVIVDRYVMKTNCK
jgi:hypothetical protein